MRSDIHNSRNRWRPVLKEALWAFLSATLLVTTCYALLFEAVHPEFENFMSRKAKSVVVPGADFILVSVGASNKVGNHLIIEEFNTDEAVLALPRTFKAEDYPFVKVNITGLTRFTKFKILWRQKEDLEVTHALEFNRSGAGVAQLAMPVGNEHYRGEIADIALLFYDGPALALGNNDNTQIILKDITFLPFSASRVMVQIYEDWFNPPLWKGTSNNFVRGAHETALILPSATVNLILLVSLGLCCFYRVVGGMLNRRPAQHNLLSTALCLCCLGWALLDTARWHWRLDQLADTLSRYSGLPLERRIERSALRCARFKKDCHKDLLPYF
jgi:hypothetical protein